jgi:hypothetical protein
MRDERIMAMDAVRSQREGLLLAQFEFLKTRQEAFEMVLVAAPWYIRFAWALWPVDLLRAVDARQTILIEKAEADMQRVRDTAKRPCVQKVPRLVVPGG